MLHQATILAGIAVLAAAMLGRMGWVDWPSLVANTLFVLTIMLTVLAGLIGFLVVLGTPVVLVGLLAAWAVEKLFGPAPEGQPGAEPT